jgi:hypothetical protein
MKYVILWGEGTPIHSKRVDLLFHHGSARDASYVLVTSVNVMALVLPIKRGLFFTGNVIRIVLPTNLLVMDRLKRGRGEGIFVPFYGIQSPLILFLLVLLEAHFGRQFS